MTSPAQKRLATRIFEADQKQQSLEMFRDVSPAVWIEFANMKQRLGYAQGRISKAQESSPWDYHANEDDITKPHDPPVSHLKAVDRG